MLAAGPFRASAWHSVFLMFPASWIVDAGGPGNQSHEESTQEREDGTVGLAPYVIGSAWTHSSSESSPIKA